MRRYEPDLDGYAYGEPRHAAGKGVLLQRTKTTRAGDYLDVDIYPVIDWAYKREAIKRGRTPEQMQRANLNRARKYCTQLCNCNFGPGDLKLDLTSAGEQPFDDFVKAKKRFMARLRARYKKTGVKLAYLGIIESTHEGRQHHIHMLLRGGVMTRDEVEKLWGLGIANADRVQTAGENEGLAGFVRYITQHKDSQEKIMRRGWFCSKGLKKPKTTYSDHKFTRGAAAKLEKAAREDAKKLFERKYPGYYLTGYSIHYSDFLPGVYIHACMKRLN